MHQTPSHQGPGGRLWLLAGTGEGPRLARRLLERGWRLRVSVVTDAAGRAYPSHAGLELLVGALGQASRLPEASVMAQVGATAKTTTDAAAAAEGAAAARAIGKALAQARQQGDPFHLVVDATHPFARQIRSSLQQGCQQAGVPLLRLERPAIPLGNACLLDSLAELRGAGTMGERLLLALGARQLAAAVAAAPWARAHARLLPGVEALRRARAAGLADGQVACLRPSRHGQVEAALVRQWQIDTVLCRQSGGVSEGLWRRVCRQEGCRLLLLRRPPEPPGSDCWQLEPLLERIGWPEP